MSKTIILKNTTEDYAQLSGMILNPLEEREISDHRILRSTLAEDNTAFAMVADGTVVVNDGTEDLTPAIGWKWLNGRFFTAELSQQSYTSGNKIWTHASPRPEKDDRTIFVYWAGAGESNSTLGSNGPIAIDVTSSDVTKSHDIRFYKGTDGLEKTYVFKAHLMWANAGFGDTVSATAMAEPLHYSK